MSEETIGRRVQLNDNDGSDSQREEYPRNSGDNPDSTGHMDQDMMEQAAAEEVERMKKSFVVAEARRLIQEAEEARRLGDMDRANEYIERARQLTDEKGPLETKIEWTRWLLTTLSLIEDVPQGSMDVFTEVEALYESGDYSKAFTLVDKLSKTAEDRMLVEWRKLRRLTKRMYRSSKKNLDPETRKQARKLMKQAFSWIEGGGIPYWRRKSLGLFRDVHEIVLPKTMVYGETGQQGQ